MGKLSIIKLVSSCLAAACLTFALTACQSQGASSVAVQDGRSSVAQEAPAAAEDTGAAADPVDTADGTGSPSSGVPNTQAPPDQQQTLPGHEYDAHHGSEHGPDHYVPSNIEVQVTIDPSNAGDKSFGTMSRSISIAEGSSVYDALKATGVSITGSSTYIRSINGLAEKACGGGSGWTYYVNGVFASTSANRYILKSGDSVTWYYVTSYDQHL